MWSGDVVAAAPPERSRNRSIDSVCIKDDATTSASRTSRSHIFWRERLNEKEGGGAMTDRNKVARSASTGKFVTKQYAKSHPRTTVVETVKRPKKR